jgi:uncharacterized metal-binding protein YceD (DUF177 family)
MIAAEFARPVNADTIGAQPRTLEIAADETERRKLAGRFGLQAIEKLAATVTLARRAGIVHADGRVDAEVVQSCVATGAPLPATIRAPFSIRYVPATAAGPAEEEVELSAEDCDTLPLAGERVDIGELAAETLALALDPFPRAADADAALAEAGVRAAAEAGPFAALKGLKDRLEKG